MVPSALPTPHRHSGTVEILPDLNGSYRGRVAHHAQPPVPVPFPCAMEGKLAQFATLNQKDKVAAYQALFNELISREDQTDLPADIHTLVDNVVNQESVGLVISRLILSELVKALSEGKVKNTELKKAIVQDTLDIIQPRVVSYEEQVSPRLS